MKSACLIVLVALTLQVTCFIFKRSTILSCCDKMNNRLHCENIKSYNRTDDKACKQSAYIVELKTGQTLCFSAKSKYVQSAIEKFDIKNPQESKEVSRQ